MEFFKLLDIETTQDWIKNNITVENLEKITETNFVIEKKGKDALIGTLWGEFDLSYDKINGGVRFALTSCPNALAWTITTGFPPVRNKIIIHLSINRTQKQQEFIDEINDFLEDWESGLTKFFNEIKDN
ncbi:MAG: hypothetical protein PF485_01105 [Bacteroidales bacterium]|jgi:hypothetical protein|nr:hypothetical protein [Bacteroidales bacterium]